MIAKSEINHQNLKTGEKEVNKRKKGLGIASQKWG